MFGIDKDMVLTAASGAEVYSDGMRYEEDDSALAIADYYFVNGEGVAGYVMQSPSARKFSVKTPAMKSFEDYASIGEAEKALLARI